MYDIIFRRDFDTINDYRVLLSNIPHLEGARQFRCLSGDLVVYHNTKIVVNSPEWLWQTEIDNPRSYAKDAMKTGMTPQEFEAYTKLLGWPNKAP